MYQRTKSTLFLIVGPYFITAIHFLTKESVLLIWLFLHLTVRQERCVPYRLVVNMFSLLYALNGLLSKLQNKNSSRLCISVTKSIINTNFFRKNTFFELPFVPSKVRHLKDARGKRPLTGSFYDIWWNMFILKTYHVTYFVVMILFSINVQYF